MKKKLFFLLLGTIILAIVCGFLLGLKPKREQLYEKGTSFGDRIEINSVTACMWQQLGTGLYLISKGADVEEYISLELLSYYTESYCWDGNNASETEKIIEMVNTKQKQGIELSYYREIFTEEFIYAGFELVFADKAKAIWYFTENQVVVKIIEK